MQQFLLYIAIVIAFGIAVWGFLWWRKRHPGISEHHVRRLLAREESKAKILELIVERGEITNDQVRNMLHISDAAATNYLQELERQQRVEQIGKRGRFVKYQLKN